MALFDMTSLDTDDELLAGTEPIIPQPERVDTPEYYVPATPAFNRDGTVNENYSSALTGKLGERLGYVQARDEGFLKEFGKGMVRGGAAFVGGVAKTIGARGTARDIAYFLDTNRQLFDSDRKSTWSYIGNVSGSAIAENAPMLAATIAAGALTGGPGAAAVLKAGGAGAAKLVAKRVLAAKLAGGGMTALMSWGENLDELRMRLPDMPESDRLVLNTFVTGLQSYIEVGLGATAQTAENVARIGLGRMLLRPGMMTALRRQGTKRLLGGLRTTVPGQMIWTGVEESGEEMLQQATMDITTSLFRKPGTNEEKWDEMLGRYWQISKEAFIGGVALGVVPATLNGFVSLDRAHRKRDLTRAHEGREDIVSSKQVEGADNTFGYVVDTEALNNTKMFFNGLFKALGYGGLRADPAQRTGAINILYNLGVNLAYEEMQTKKTQAERETIRPEKYFETLRTLVLSNPEASAQINKLISDNEDMTGGDANIIKGLNDILPEFGEQIYDLQQIREMQDLRRSTDGVRKELTRVLGEDFDQPNNPVQENAAIVARRVAGAVAKWGTSISLAARHVNESVTDARRAIDPNTIDKIFNTLGEAEARKVYAMGWIFGITIGKERQKVAIKLDKENSGRIAGIVYDNDAGIEEAMLDEGAGVIKEAALAEMISGLRVATEMDLANEKANVLRLGSIFDRWDNYVKPITTTKAPLGATKIEEPPVTPIQQTKEGITPTKKGEVTPEVTPEIAKEAIPKEKVEPEPEYEGNKGVYLKHQRLAVFFSNHDVATIIHELTHHILENNLMPENIKQAFLDNFVIGEEGDKEKRSMLNKAEKENVANSILSYIKNETVPDDPALAKAYSFIKKMLNGSRVMNMFLGADGTIKTGTMEIPLSNDVKRFLASILQPIETDRVGTIYGHTLDRSLMAGDVSELNWVDTSEVNVRFQELASLRGMTPMSLAKDIFERYKEGLHNKTSLATMTPNELFFLDQKLKQEMRDSGATIAEHPAVVWEETKAEPTTEVEWESKPLTEKTDKELHSYIAFTLSNKKKGDKKIADVETARANAQANFGKNKLEELTRSQLIELAGMMEEERGVPTPIAKQKNELTQELTEDIKKYPGIRKNVEFEKAVSVGDWLGMAAVRAGRSFVRNIDDPATFVEYLSNRFPNSAFVRKVSQPILEDRRKVEIAQEQYIKDFMRKCNEEDSDPNNIYVVEKIGGANVTHSTILEIWTLSDFGKNVDFSKGSRLDKMIRSNPAMWDKKLVQDILKWMSEDKVEAKEIKAIGKIQQEGNTAEWGKMEPVYEKVMGKPIKPIKGAYSTGAYEDESTASDDQDHNLMDYAYKNREGETTPIPPEHKHATPNPGSKYDTDCFSKHFRHINTLINYRCKAENVAEILAALENDEMTAAFRENFGEESYLRALIKLTRREMSPTGNLRRRGGPLDKPIARITQKMQAALLGWNLNVMPTQATTIGPAMAVLGNKAVPRLFGNLSKVIFQAIQRGGVSKADAYALAETAAPEIMSLWKSQEKSQLERIIETKKMTGLRTGNQTFAKFLQWGMFPLTASDMGIRLATFQTAFEIKMDELRNSDIDKNERYRIAKEFANQVILKSHNPATTGERGLVQSESGAAVRSMFAFTSQQFANMKFFTNDVWLPLLLAYQKSGVLGLGKEVGTNRGLWRRVAYGALLPGIMLGAIGRRRPQKDLKEVLQDAFVMGIGNLIPIIGQVLWMSAVVGWGGKGDAFSGMHGQMMNAITDVLTSATGEKPKWNSIPSLIRVTEAFTGIPDYPFRIARSVMERVYIEGGELDGKTLFEAFRGRQME